MVFSERKQQTGRESQKTSRTVGCGGPHGPLVNDVYCGNVGVPAWGSCGMAAASLLLAAGHLGVEMAFIFRCSVLVARGLAFLGGQSGPPRYLHYSGTESGPPSFPAIPDGGGSLLSDGGG